MDSFLQLKSLGFSLFYGWAFFYLAKGNLILTNNLKIIGKYLITLIFVIDIALLYLYLMFQINQGIFHIYFFFMFALGYFGALMLHPKIVKLCQIWQNKRK